MLAVGLLPFLIFGALALLPLNESSDGFDAAPDRDDTPEEENPDGENPDGEPAGPTTITLSNDEGADQQIVVDGTDVEDGDPAVVEGTETRDVFDVPTNPTVPIQLNTLGGDDAVGFGYSTSVDPGEGTDVLELTITQDALDNAQLEFGTITFNDSADALAIDIAEDATGFLHEISVESSTSVDAITTTSTETLYYVLSQSETLTIDQTASEVAGVPVFTNEDAQVLAEIDLGTLTRVTGTNEDDEPTETITGSINEAPVIALNRELTSEQTLVLPTTAIPEEEGEGQGEGEGEGEGEEQGAPEVTIATDGGEPTTATIVDGRVSGTDTSDVITATEAAPSGLTVDLGNGDDTVNLTLGQSVVAAQNIDSDAFNDEGTDLINYSISTDAFAAAQGTNAAATTADDLAEVARIELGDADTLTFDIATEIEGRLIEVRTVTDNSGGGGGTDNTFTNFYLIVPEATDLDQAFDDFPNGTGASVADYFVTTYDAVALAVVPLGNQTAGDPDDGEDPTTTGNRVTLTDVVANREIETVSWSLNG